MALDMEGMSGIVNDDEGFTGGLCAELGVSGEYDEAMMLAMSYSCK